MKLYIKNMVCSRCKTVVLQELEALGHQVLTIELGEVVLEKPASEAQLDQISERLQAHDFELLSDKKQQLIERVKTAIVELVHLQNDGFRRMKHSDYITEKVNRDYRYLSTLFPEVEGITIEQYLINQKLERVKELLVYDELTLSQIADLLNYSSVAHLSAQFKSITGMTPSQFKKLRDKNRKPLDKV
jgi:AraC-like DNA-binding protein